MTEINAKIEGTAGNASANLSGKPWGFWLTILFSTSIGLAFFLAQSIMAGVFLALAKVLNPAVNIHDYARALEGNGLYWSAATCAGALPLIFLSLLLAYAKRNISVHEYLGIRKIEIWKCCRWVLLIVLFAAITDGFSYLTGRDIVPKVVLDAYNSAHFTPLLIFAIVIVAPLSEEIFFRGFLFKGIQDSKLGAWGAVTITSALWALTHVQYDFYGIAVIFASSILLGIAKIRTGSLLTTIAMHSAMNIIATLEAVFISS